MEQDQLLDQPIMIDWEQAARDLAATPEGLQSMTEGYADEMSMAWKRGDQGAAQTALQAAQNEGLVDPTMVYRRFRQFNPDAPQSVKEMLAWDRQGTNQTP